MTRHRNAFTLIELLVVITIIGILAGLLVPVVWGAVKRGRQAQAEAQVNVLAQALASYQAKHGDYPPSRLIFHETGYLGTPPAGNRYFSNFVHATPQPNIGGTDLGPAAGSPEHAGLVLRSVLALRKMFPRARFSADAWTPGSPALAPAGQWYDINGNRGSGPDAEPILIEGHEALFLALCGMGDWDGDSANGFKLRGAGGLNSNPRNPFVPVDPTGASPGSRTEIFYDLSDPSMMADDDRDGIPALLDPLGLRSDARYVVYFAPHGGHYDPRDVQFEPTSPAEFFLPGTGMVVAAGPNPWAFGETNRAGVAPNWVRKQSYQLLSPGLDRRYGPGGGVDNSGASWEFPAQEGGPSRRAEEDNVGLRQ
jgi:prepilin-type N-terminal cleavage/methylation domain-containing protein